MPLWTIDMRVQYWWGLSTHCAQAKGQRVVCAFIQVQKPPLWALNPDLTAGYLSPSKLLLAPILLQAPLPQNSLPSCSAFYSVDFRSPCFMFRLNPAICMLEKYWQFSNLSYLLKAFPHSNVALFSWGKVCVLLNSECWVPRIAYKINVNQV